MGANWHAHAPSLLQHDNDNCGVPDGRGQIPSSQVLLHRVNWVRGICCDQAADDIDRPVSCHLSNALQEGGEALPL